MAVPITWDNHGHPNKLKKHNVHFTPTLSEVNLASTVTPLPPSDPTPIGLPTPDTTPEGSEKKVKKKGSLMSRLTSRSTPSDPRPPSPTASDEGGAGDTDRWVHLPSYFPEYTPIYSAPTTIPGVPGVMGHDRYFPEYTPITYSNYPASGAYGYALDPAQAQASAHTARVGHNVVVHYPDLPKFADYGGGSKGWTSAKWGVEGWNGYGWEGEKLPNTEGQTFGAPMPKGMPLPKEGKEGKEGGGGAKKKKDGGDGEGGEGEEGEKKEGGGGGEGGAEGGEAAAEGGGEGGKKKKKKK